MFNLVYFADADTLINLLDIETKLKKAFRKALSVKYVNNLGKTVSKFIKPEINSDPDESQKYILVVSLNFEFIQDADMELTNGVNDEFDTGEFDNPELMEILEITERN